MSAIEMPRPYLLAPSILAGDLSKLAEEAKAMQAAGADVLHLDIMDGQFVPNITFGFPVIEKLRKHCTLPFDAHLMIANPERYLDDFAQCGCDWVSVHVEACHDLPTTLSRIQELGMKAGVAISPPTPLAALDPILSQADYFVVMGVNPGFAGQKFMDNSFNRVRYLKQKIGNKPIRIQIDGGIKKHNLQQAIDAGSDIIVMGTGLFGVENYMSEIQSIHSMIKTSG